MRVASLFRQSSMLLKGNTLTKTQGIMSNQNGSVPSLEEPGACNLGCGTYSCPTSEQKREKQTGWLSPSSTPLLSSQGSPTAIESGCGQVPRPFHPDEGQCSGVSLPGDHRTRATSVRQKADLKAVPPSSSSVSSEACSDNSPTRRYQRATPYDVARRVLSAVHSIPEDRHGRVPLSDYEEPKLSKGVSSADVTGEGGITTRPEPPQQDAVPEARSADSLHSKKGQQTTPGPYGQCPKISVASPSAGSVPVSTTPQNEMASNSPTPPSNGSDQEEAYECSSNLQSSDSQHLPTEKLHNSTHWHDRSPSSRGDYSTKEVCSPAFSLPASFCCTASSPDIKLTVGACHASSPPSLSHAPSVADGEEDESDSPGVLQQQQASERAEEELQEEGTYTSSSQDYGEGGGVDRIQEERTSFSVDGLAATKEPGREEEYKGGNHSRSLSPSYYKAQLDRCPKVVGVRFDKTQCRWLAGISVNGKTMNKYFPVYKYGFDGARRMAVNHRLACLRNQGKSALAASIAAAAAQLEPRGGDDGGEERTDSGEDLLQKVQEDEELRSEHLADRSRSSPPSGPPHTSGRTTAKEGGGGRGGLVRKAG